MREKLKLIPQEQASEQELYEGKPKTEHEAARMLVNQLYEIMQKEQVYAVKILTNTDVFDLIEEEEKFINYVEKGLQGGSIHQFFVFEGAHPTEKSTLFKIRATEQTYQHADNNEIYFYRDMSEDLMRDMPQRLKEKIAIPVYKTSDDSQDKGHNFVMTEFTEGKTISNTTYEAKENPMTKEEYEAIIEFIQYFQEKMTPEYVAEKYPHIDRNAKGSASSYEMHLDRFEEKKGEFEKMLGHEYVEKMETLLEEKRDLLQNSKKIFTNQDINVANLIRTKDGKLCNIDWERLKEIPNEAAAYTYLPTAHWQYPELQEKMNKMAIESNQDKKNFKELMRLDYIFFRYSRIAIMYYWPITQNPNAAPEKKEHAQKAIDIFTNLIKEAIDEKGIWSK